jgi:hypothetical protein
MSSCILSIPPSSHGVGRSINYTYIEAALKIYDGIGPMIYHKYKNIQGNWTYTLELINNSIFDIIRLNGLVKEAKHVVR